MSLVERSSRPGADESGHAAARPPVDHDLLFAPIEPVSERVSVPAFGTGRRTESRGDRARRLKREAASERRAERPSWSQRRAGARSDTEAGSERERPRPPRPHLAAWFGDRPQAPERLPRASRRAKALLTPAHRRRTIQRVRRSGGLVVALVAVAALVVVGQSRADKPGIPGAPGTGAGARAEVPTATLLSIEGAEGAVAGLTVAVTEPEGGGGFVHVPTGAMVEVPSFGLERLGESFVLGGPELVRSGLENLFGVQIAEVIELSPTDLAALAPRGVVVELPATVERVNERGRVEVLWPAGAIRLNGADVHRFLTEEGEETQLDLLVRHQAFWSALVSQVGDQVPAGPLADVLGLLAAGEVEHHTLPAESLGIDDVGGELYKVDRSATAALVERVMEGAPPVSAADRIRVQLLNGTGEPGQARTVTAALVPAGAQVVVVGNADRFDHDVTQIVFYDKDERDRAEAVREALGVGEVVFSRNRLDVVDITVVVGSDFS